MSPIRPSACREGSGTNSTGPNAPRCRVSPAKARKPGKQGAVQGTRPGVAAQPRTRLQHPHRARRAQTGKNARADFRLRHTVGPGSGCDAKRRGRQRLDRSSSGRALRVFRVAEASPAGPANHRTGGALPLAFPPLPPSATPGRIDPIRRQNKRKSSSINACRESVFCGLSGLQTIRTVRFDCCRFRDAQFALWIAWH